MSAALCLVFIAQTSGLAYRWFGLQISVPPDLAFLAYNLGIMFWGSCAQKCLLGSPRWQEWMVLVLTTGLVFFPPVWSLLHMNADNQAGVMRFAGGYGLGLLLFVLGVTVCKIRVAFLAYVGKVSYSLYLFHPIVFYTLLYLIQAGYLGFLGGLHIALYIVLSMALSILFAAAVYRWVEAPAIARGRAHTRSA